MSNTLELTDRQRERLDAIKDDLEEAEPECPRATDEQVLKSLLDTWDAVGEGLYSESPVCPDCGHRTSEVDPPGTAGSQTWECPNCQRAITQEGSHAE